jgi:hypothetical protein
VDHFSYFMLRLHHHGEATPEPVFTGMVQQLSTGEKRAFAGAGELLDLLLHWPRPPDPKLEAAHGENKTVAAEEDGG